MRDSAKLTQQELAERAGTTQSVIARLEDAEYTGHSIKMPERIASACTQKRSPRWTASWFWSFGLVKEVVWPLISSEASAPSPPSTAPRRPVHPPQHRNPRPCSVVVYSCQGTPSAARIKNQHEEQISRTHN
ncbi:MAG: helix-turn-helix domain-containing protein [Candidatus Acidiferrales bacterium]